MVRRLFSYTKHQEVGKVTQLLCVQRLYCKIRLQTKGNNVITRKNHESNSHIFYINEAKAGMKCNAQSVWKLRILS